jgi:hypothetical protein
MTRHIGIDLGTNTIISGVSVDNNTPMFKVQRDAFFNVVAKTEINKISIKNSLDKRGVNYITADDGSFLIVGQDAIEMAVERNSTAQRPMSKGVISPKEKASLPMLKLLIEGLIGRGEPGDKCVYSIPSKPIDADFDIVYHDGVMKMYLKEMGYEATSINEAYAVGLSELLDDGLNGIAISCGAGQINICILHDGEQLVDFSTTKAGDYIDNAVSLALDLNPSFVQFEKESGTDLLNPSTKIMEAVSVYYDAVLSYTLKSIAYELRKREKELPLFRNKIPMVFAGGLSLASGFVSRVNDLLVNIDFPINIGEVRLATNPLYTVANGALLASQL